MDTMAADVEDWTANIAQRAAFTGIIGKTSGISQIKMWLVQLYMNPSTRKYMNQSTRKLRKKTYKKTLARQFVFHEKSHHTVATIAITPHIIQSHVKASFLPCKPHQFNYFF